MVYMGHHRFLPSTHRYCKNKKIFNGTLENREPPKFKTGRQIIKIVNKLKVVLGKGAGNVPTPTKSAWKKSVFWKLPYWRTLHVRHTLDGMHITKNITEGLLGTLMQSKGKGKDSLQCHMDLEAMGVRAELHPLTLPDDKNKVPVASWSLETK